MLRKNMFLKSGDAPQEFFDRHISKVLHAVSGVNKASVRRGSAVTVKNFRIPLSRRYHFDIALHSQ